MYLAEVYDFNLVFCLFLLRIVNISTKLYGKDSESVGIAVLRLAIVKKQMGNVLRIYLSLKILLNGLT